MFELLPLPSRIGFFAFLGSSALLAGALYFQYVEHLRPCEMCLWQRYPHAVAIVVGLFAVASFAYPRLALVFALLAITALLVTSGIGVFHFGVEQHWWQGPRHCTGAIPSGLSPEQLKKYLLSTQMVRCDLPAWELWSISMAGWNAILSGGLGLVLAVGVAVHIKGGQE